jgi:hypothetical protein
MADRGINEGGENRPLPRIKPMPNFLFVMYPRRSLKLKRIVLEIETYLTLEETKAGKVTGYSQRQWLIEVGACANNRQTENFHDSAWKTTLNNLWSCPSYRVECQFQS